MKDVFNTIAKATKPVNNTTVTDTKKVEGGKHTQGGWIAKQSSGNNIYNHTVICPNIKTICKMEADSFDDIEETKANAKLIAASPLLLEAIQKTLENIAARIEYFKREEGENSFNAAVFQSIVNIHTEAINKATL